MTARRIEFQDAAARSVRILSIASNSTNFISPDSLADIKGPRSPALVHRFQITCVAQSLNIA
jgi:hypothetical protein